MSLARSRVRPFFGSFRGDPLPNQALPRGLPATGSNLHEHMSEKLANADLDLVSLCETKSLDHAGG
jgi:hypothetical protein